MSRIPDLEAWAVFAKVADTTSFARAARELGVSKATISKSVSRLETRIGAALFHRTSRRLSLTAMGEASVVAAHEILARGEQLEAAAMEQAATPRGTVRLAAPMSFGVAHLAPLLPDLLATHPQIAVDLHLSDHLVDLVADRFDLALRIGALSDSTLRSRRIAEVHVLLVGAPGYFARHGQPAQPQDLARHQCLGYGHASTTNRWRFVHATTGEEAAVAPQGPLRANNGDVLLPAVLHGIGLAVAPDFMVWDALAAGRLVAAMPDWRLPSVGLHAVTPPGSLRPARVSAVIDFLVTRLSPAPWRTPGGPASGPTDPASH